MRLAQLSRKIAVKSSHIVEWLASQQIVVEDNANAKIDDEHLPLILAHFAPTLNLAEVEETFQAPQEMVEEPLVTLTEVKVTEEINVTSIPEELVATDKEETHQSDELPDIIRAPKIALTGLKVIGKIELPEKKVKEEIITHENVSIASEEVKSNRKDRKPNERKRNEKGPRRNAIAEAREREMKALEERRLQEEQSKKELRKQNYLKLREAKKPAKPLRTEEVKEKKTIIKIKKKEEPISLFARFMRWLTSNQ